MRDWFRGLFDAELRERRAFEKLTTKVVSKNQQHEDRMLALETLAGMESDEALSALFRRWDMTAEKEREDRAEKEYLAKLLVAKGEGMLGQLRAHNDRSVNVTWPIQVMKDVVDDEEVVSEILRVLIAEGKRLASFKPEKKVTLLRLLQAHEDPRIPPAAVPFLDDFDESVRYEAAELLALRHHDGTVDALVARLGHEEEDSARVRGAILGALATIDPDLGPHRKTIDKHMVEGWSMGKDGKLQAP